jgi:hypothetical protein
MRKGLIAVAVALLAFLAGYQVRALESVHAQDKRARNVVVPKNWGTFRAVYYDQLLFEDDSGTIRSVYPSSNSVVFTVTRR